MNKFTPWKIENGTLQLLPWEHGAGDVLVEVDVFEPHEVAVVDLDGDTVCHTLPPGVGSHDTDPWDYDDVLRDLFAHIDANPQTTFHLVTEHPERVRDAWPPVPEVGEDDWCDGSGPESCPGCGNCVRYRPNVTLSALIHTQAEADQRLPVLLELADPCREVYPTCRPVERIDLGHLLLNVCRKCGESPDDGPWENRCYSCGAYKTVPPLVRDSRYPHDPYYRVAIPRIVVSGGPEPMHPDPVRDLRDQAESAGVPFVFMGWGDWLHMMQFGCGEHDLRGVELRGPINAFMARVGSENSGCELDDKTYPWESEVKA